MSMKEKHQQIISEETGHEQFAIDNPQKAEWALKQIQAKQEELQEYISVCDGMIDDYNEKKKKAQEQYESSINYFKLQLEDFFRTVKTSKTKTQESYKLPTGKLVLKYPKPKFVKDDDLLVSWLKASGRKELIKVKESPNWSELKSTVEVNGSNVITEDGEIIEGVSVEMSEPEFEIKI